ncbi:MAG: C40 family peptidase [Bacteroidota bacterium]
MRNFLWLSLVILLMFGGRKLLIRFTNLGEKSGTESPIIPTIPAGTSDTLAEEVLPIPTLPPLPTVHPEIEEILEKARELEGSPYLGGGDDPEGFDCSGFVRYVYQDIGVVLPRSSSAMALVGQSIERQNVLPGDLLFFTGSDASTTTVGHVALVLQHESNQLLMIHASNRGVVIDDYYEMPYYQERYLSANRPYAK